jgi:alpha/beta superfamily hydrolase
MSLPKYILGDNTDHPDAIFVIHTEFPRFIINLENDEVEWFEEFDQHDEKELEQETESCIKEATAFYDREVARYDDA